MCCCANHMICMHHGLIAAKSQAAMLLRLPAVQSMTVDSAVSYINAFSCALQQPSTASCFCIGVKVHLHLSTAVTCSEMEVLSALQSCLTRSDHITAMSTWCLTMTQQLSMSAWPSSQTSSEGASQVCSLHDLPEFVTVCCVCIIVGHTLTGIAEQLLPLRVIRDAYRQVQRVLMLVS